MHPSTEVKNFSRKAEKERQKNQVPPTGIPLTIFGDSFRRRHGCENWPSKQAQSWSREKRPVTRQQLWWASSGMENKRSEVEARAGFPQETALSLLVFCWWLKQTSIGIYCLCTAKSQLPGCASMYAQLWGCTKCCSRWGVRFKLPGICRNLSSRHQGALVT